MNETINNEIMSLADMEKKFEGEWVLFEDPYLDDRKQLAGGKLLCHSKIREDVDEVAERLRPKRAAILYMGPMPDFVAFNL